MPAKSLSIMHLEKCLNQFLPTDFFRQAFNFLYQHTSYSAEFPANAALSEEQIQLALTRCGKPVWTDNDFQHFIVQLQYSGFGWLRPEGVKRELEKMTKDWRITSSNLCLTKNKTAACPTYHQLEAEKQKGSDSIPIDDIAFRAYLIEEKWEKEGIVGDTTDAWVVAEKELRAEMKADDSN